MNIINNSMTVYHIDIKLGAKICLKALHPHPLMRAKLWQAIIMFEFYGSICK